MAQTRENRIGGGKLEKDEEEDPLQLAPRRPQLVYTACYCEENVWKLCEDVVSKLVDKDGPTTTANAANIAITTATNTTATTSTTVGNTAATTATKTIDSDHHISGCYAVFISNPTRKVPIWCQRSSKDPRNVPVLWDYHVILVFRGNGEDGASSSLSSSLSSSWVYDFDTVLSFPSPFDVYFRESFRQDEELKRNYRRFFRVISAREYLARFASDRSHMRRKDGSWMSPPPGYPPILAPADGATNNIDRWIDVTDKTWHGAVLDAPQFHRMFAGG